MEMILRLKLAMDQVKWNKLCVFRGHVLPSYCTVNKYSKITGILFFFFGFLTKEHGLRLVKVRSPVKTYLMEIILRLKVGMDQLKKKKLCCGYLCRFLTSALTLRPRMLIIYVIGTLFHFSNS